MIIHAIRLHRTQENTYPYTLPIFDQDLIFTHPVTVIVGDNGSGKSTLLDIIANELSLFRIGTPIGQNIDVRCDLKRQPVKPKGICFSAEDFTVYIREQEMEKARSREELKRVEKEYAHRSKLSLSLARMPHQRQLSELDALHDRNLSESSHGEAYLSFFKSRMRPNHLILLDEPETPLSFTNQIALLYLIQDAVSMGCQIIIATHSPIIMHFPSAHLIEITPEGFQKRDVNQIESIQLMREFLNHPERFLRHLHDKEDHQTP